MYFSLLSLLGEFSWHLNPGGTSCKKSIRKNNSTRKHILYLKMCFLVEFFFLVEFYMKRPLTYALLHQSISLMQKEKNWMHFQSRREKTHSSDEKTHKWNSQLLMVHTLLLHTYMQCSDVLLEMWSVYSYILIYLLMATTTMFCQIGCFTTQQCLHPCHRNDLSVSIGL